ncbi:hypothetical protein FPY71_07200 [Aureimonas fodinaquatilis]|uniref:Uncharacterized protein n=1 Tax=Aureimonas fodinaquatilis TaxID=2565783 RepID=A0A5B0DV84_9HYPH|nr:hypothetical protein [Aureimonas fodinaquatilis]KAA0970303.1 hypothetical protein FPY71_07200 [Aureimonas fodinaquatilis]
MPLKLVLDSLDGLDDTTRALYSEKDGKFRLDVEGVEDTEGLKRKNAELLAETKSEREKRQALERQHEEAEQARQREAGEFKTLYEKSQTDLEKERNDNRTFRQTIQDRDREAAAASLASELTRDTARAALLKKEALAFAEFTDQGVQFKIGGIQQDKAKVLEHLKTQYPFLVDGNQSNGGGANGGSGGAAGKKLSDLNDEERLKLAREDPAAFRKLREASL